MKTLFKAILLSSLAILTAVPSFAQSEKTIKRKVAIGRFSNETTYGKGVFYDKENDPMGKQALDILSAKLASSGKFILLEREDLDVLVSEGGAGMDKIGADYVILGSLTSFGRKSEGHEKVFSSTKTQVVEAGVSLRLVDVASRRIIYADEAKGSAETTSKTTLGLGGTSGFDATLSDKAISAAMSQLVENIINKCMDKPWRAYILTVDDGVYVVSGGTSQGIASGDVFNVYRKGKMVTNPQTGIKIEMPGTKVGTVTVTQCLGDTVDNEISMCRYNGEAVDSAKLLDYYISDK